MDGRRWWVALGGLGALAAVAMLVVVLALRDGGGGAPARPAETPTPGAPTPGPSATPSPAVTPEPFGVPVRDLVLGEPEPLQAGAVVYYTWAFIEGPSNNLWRAYRTASGELKMEDLFKLPEGQPFTTAFDFEHGRLAVGLCRQSYCGGYGSPEPDSKAVLATSEDGGATWAVGPALPVGTFLAGYTDRGLLTGRIAEGPTIRRADRYFPSGVLLDLPEGSPNPFVSEDGELAFQNAAGRVTNEAGAVLYEPPPLDVEGAPRYLVDRRPWAWSRWTDAEESDHSIRYWGERDGARFTRVFRWRGPGFGFQAQVDADHFLGRLDFDQRSDDRRVPVEIDVSTAVIHPLTDFVDPGSRYFSAYRVLPGTFSAARPGSGSCLNVRERASLTAAVLKCVADGVLLKVLAVSPVSADGVTWLQVEMLDGRDGWASAAFLEP
jgi:hypothetical protein